MPVADWRPERQSHSLLAHIYSSSNPLSTAVLTVPPAFPLARKNLIPMAVVIRHRTSPLHHPASLLGIQLVKVRQTLLLALCGIPCLFLLLLLLPQPFSSTTSGFTCNVLMSFVWGEVG
jgi:hypothetical protein